MSWNKRYTITEIREYVEPLLNQAKPDCWYGEYGYVHGYVGNPIIAAIIQLKKESQEKAQRIVELEKSLEHYTIRYNEAIMNAKSLLGVK